VCGPHSLAPLKTRYNTGAGLTVNTGAVFGQTSAVSDRCLFAASRLHSARKQWPVRRRRCAEQQTDVNHAVTSCRVLSVDAKPGRLLFSRTCHRTVNTPPSCPGWPTSRLPSPSLTAGAVGRACSSSRSLHASVGLFRISTILIPFALVFCSCLPFLSVYLYPFHAVSQIVILPSLCMLSLSICCRLVSVYVSLLLVCVQLYSIQMLLPFNSLSSTYSC